MVNNSEQIHEKLIECGLDVKPFIIKEKNFYSLVLTVKEKLSDKEPQLNHLSFTFNLFGSSEKVSVEFNYNYAGFRKMIDKKEFDTFDFGKAVKEINKTTKLFVDEAKKYNKLVNQIKRQRTAIDNIVDSFGI